VTKIQKLYQYCHYPFFLSNIFQGTKRKVRVLREDRDWQWILTLRDLRREAAVRYMVRLLTVKALQTFGGRSLRIFLSRFFEVSERTGLAMEEVVALYKGFG
jgi:hypothetical protein